jgi:hypothetical protein
MLDVLQKAFVSHYYSTFALIGTTYIR